MNDHFVDDAGAFGDGIATHKVAGSGVTRESPGAHHPSQDILAFIPE